MTEVLFSSSYDDSHPPQNTLNSNKEFWTTTGLYPQELCIQLDSTRSINSVSISSFGVKHIILETCESESAGTFIKQAEMVDVPSSNGKLQEYFLNFTQQSSKVKILKLKILDGYEEFCSVHSIVFK